MFGGGGPGGPAENPELIAAGEAFDRAEAALADLDRRIRAARAVFDEMCPAPPQELLGLTDEFGHGPDSSICLKDVEGHYVYQNDKHVWIAHLPYLRIETADYSARTKRGRAARARLKLAQAYQAAFEAAKEQSGIAPLAEARPAALEHLKEVGESVFAVPALTTAGLRIKAHAFTVYTRFDTEKAEWEAKLWWSPRLAENILSVTAPA